MRSVYIVGTDHRYQRGFALGVDETAFDQFRQLLRSIIICHRIRSIAEEMSIDGLSKHIDTGGSVGFHLAEEAGLAHRYCDPDIATRKSKGITSGKQRERYWLEQLQSFDCFPVLFIAGAEHVESFKQLLTQSGIQAFVEHHDWQPASTTHPGD